MACASISSPQPDRVRRGIAGWQARRLRASMTFMSPTRVFPFGRVPTPDDVASSSETVIRTPIAMLQTRKSTLMVARAAAFGKARHPARLPRSVPFAMATLGADSSR
jgi:hypothetical protein